MTLSELQRRASDRGLVAVNFGRSGDEWQASARRRGSDGWAIGHGATMEEAAENLLSRGDSKWAALDVDDLGDLL